MYEFRRNKYKPFKKNILQKLRVHKGLLQVDMAKLCKMSINTYRLTEANKRALLYNEASVIANYFGLSVYQLYENNEE